MSALHDKGLVSEYDWLEIHGEDLKAQLGVQAQDAEIERQKSQALTRHHEAKADLQEMQKDLAQLEGQLAESEAIALGLETGIERRRIIAPVSGRIGEILPDARIGAFLSEGALIAKIVPLDKLKVVADFLPEDALGRLRAGQHGRLRLDAFPWAQYGSIAVAVDRVGEEIHAGHQQVEATIIGFPHMRLQHGLTGSLEIAVEKASPADLVLRAAGRMLARRVPAHGMNRR